MAAGLLTQAQLDECLRIQQSSGKRVGEILLERRVLGERQIMDALQKQLGLRAVDFNRMAIDREVPRLIREHLARRHLLVPVERDGNRLTVAMVDPLNLFAIDDVAVATGLEVIPAIASRRAVLDALDRYYGKESAEQAAEDIGKALSPDDIGAMQSTLLSEVDNAPVVRMVNSMLQHAIRARASDIHLEPGENNLRVRFRIDGELQEIMALPRASHPAIVTRIKIGAGLDIAEKRLPQDGRDEVAFDGYKVDLRVSVLPTVYGEKVVLRLLDRSGVMLTKSQLGVTDGNIRLFERIIANPSGIVLVTGPTGSGKTTTLYAILKERNRSERNIITVEDPVEYRLEGVNQVQVNPKAGLTFANGLRSILRQDPDIIMIGEIRDSETAQIAIRAAITGHLVLSTLHTNDAASTVSRLLDMGIEPYLISSALAGVVAQRLVRKICDHCKEPYTPTRWERALLGGPEGATLYRGRGCGACNRTGYLGRTAIHEILIVGSEIRDLIDRRAAAGRIRDAAAAQGTTSLRHNCAQLVRAGVTTVEELLRVTYSLTDALVDSAVPQVVSINKER